jgi:transcription elongation factor GreA
MVSELEADPDLGKVSIGSPIGQALLGHQVDEVVEIEVPVGILKYKIKDIKRA